MEVKTNHAPYAAKRNSVLSQPFQPAVQRGFARNVATLSLGTALAQCVGVASAPVLTRLYSPSDLGVLGLFLSFVSVATVTTSLSYELGIISAPSNGEAARLTCASMLVSLPACIVCGSFLYAVMHFQWLGYGSLPGYSLPLMVVTLLFMAAFSNLRYWEIRHEHFHIVARTTLLQQTVRSVSQIVFGILAAGPMALLLGETMGRGAGVGSLLRNAWGALKSVAATARKNEFVSALAENRNLAIYSLPSSLIDTLAANIVLPLIVQLYGAAMGGQFALTCRVLAVPLALIATSVADTFHSRVALCVREKPDQVLTLFLRTTAGLFSLALIPALVLFFFGDRLFALVFGERWSIAGTLAGISAPLFLAQMVVSPLSRLVFVLRGQKSKLIYDVALMTGTLLIFGLSWRQKFTLIHTVWAITLVNILCYIIYYAVLLRIVIKARPQQLAHASRV